MTWHDIWFGLSNTWDGMWSNGVGKNRETDGENDEVCVEEGFQLAMVNIDRNGVRGRETLGVENCIMNIWDGSELELAWSKKCSPYFEKNLPIF